jgi:hypothetical protein
MSAAQSSGGAPEEAPFVFDAEVLEVGSSTAPEFTGEGPTAVVRIDRVVSATRVLVNTVGMLVTIELASGERVQAGKVYEFSTYPRLFADTIVAASAGHADVGTTAQLDVPVDSVDTRARRAIRVHAADADLIAIGRVVAVRLVPGLQDEPMIENDPHWREAEVEVSEWLKGEPPSGGHLLVLFATSRHPAWRGYPKLEVGFEGVFMLHSISSKEAGGSEAKYAVTHEWDVQPISRVNEVRDRA